MKTTVEQRRKARLWKLANRDRVLEHGRRYREKNRDKILAYTEAHREARNLAQKQKRWANPEEYYRKRREKRQSQIEIVRARERADRLKKPAYWHLKGVRKRARTAKMECDLDVAWVQQRLDAGVCELSGIPFDFHKGWGFAMMRPNGPSIDRKDPKGPYTKANCRMILWWLNRALSNLGEDYALGVFRAIFEKRGEILPFEDRMAA